MCALLGAKKCSELRLVLRLSSVDITLNSLRDALYNFLFARANCGKFVLQLGIGRNGRQPNQRKIEHCLEHYGLEPDEGPTVGGPYAPYSVAKRLKTYSDVVERLLDAGLAYRCFCLTNSGQQQTGAIGDHGPSSMGISICVRNCARRGAKESNSMAVDGLQYVVRLKMQSTCVRYSDARYGQLVHRLNNLEYLLLKPDFRPTVLLATVVDSRTLCATHQIISSPSQFNQLALYSALQWTPPTILQIGELKLRNRHRSIIHGIARRSFLRIYKDLPPTKVLNFLANGRGFRNHTGNGLQTLAEMVEQFQVEALPSSCLIRNTYKLLKPQKEEIIARTNTDSIDSCRNSSVKPINDIGVDQLTNNYFDVSDEKLADGMYVGGCIEPYAKC